MSGRDLASQPSSCLVSSRLVSPLLRHDDCHSDRYESSFGTATPVTHAGLPETAVVHPLVLLSAVDHYNRVAKNTKKRIVGILLGQRQGSVVNVANSFAGEFS